MAEQTRAPAQNVMKNPELLARGDVMRTDLT
jgi:hypothetical protein